MRRQPGGSGSFASCDLRGAQQRRERRLSDTDGRMGPRDRRMKSWSFVRGKGGRVGTSPVFKPKSGTRASPEKEIAKESGRSEA